MVVTERAATGRGAGYTLSTRLITSVHYVGTGETLFERIAQRRLLIDSSDLVLESARMWRLEG